MDQRRMGKVWFVGAGPGDPELITVKGKRLIEQADLVLYAGSLVPPEVVAGHKPTARVVDSAPLSLPQTHQLLMDTVWAGGTAARVHTGDPSLYGAVREQTRLLDREGVDWEIVPGVTAAFAAAAQAGESLTVPGITQSVILTRLAGRTPVPEAERLSALAAHHSSLAVYLSGADASVLARELTLAGRPPETRIIAAHQVGWPAGQVVKTTLAGLQDHPLPEGFHRQTVFLVLPAGDEDRASRLYDPSFSHSRRKGGG